MFKKINVGVLVLLLLLTLIPAAFAGDVNETNQISLSDTDDILSAGDIYFDASAVDDTGTGSVNNPYKYLYTSRIRSNSVLHFTNGEYNLSDSKTVYTVFLIGENPDLTVIRASGELFTVSGTLTLQNIKISNGMLTNHGTIRATNTIFENSTASAQDSYGNSFGGAIFNDGEYYYPSVYLTNCTFQNNYAEYGGAIYLNGGNLNIINSRFINNTAFNYGGAIACEDTSTLSITNSLFINDSSLHDAGGAVYIRNSSLTVANSNFTGCSASFGGAICDLSTRSTITGLIANSNSASYQGGALYKMYGTVTIADSEFSSNSARDGAAIAADNTTNFVLRNSDFIQNTANRFGGAVYSFSNTRSTLSNINYDRNKALSSPDLYESQSLDLNIGNGNYQMLMYDDSNYDGDIPSYYDLRNYGWVTPVRDQQTSGNCWAFSAIAALESCILKASNISYDLSEENLKNLIEFYSDYGWLMQTNEGGYDEMSIGYLVSWLGPVNESSDLFDDYSTLSGVVDSVMHVQNIIYLPRYSTTDNDLIKQAIMKYGAVSTGIYYDSSYLNYWTHYFIITEETKYIMTVHI